MNGTKHEPPFGGMRVFFLLLILLAAVVLVPRGTMVFAGPSDEKPATEQETKTKPKTTFKLPPPVPQELLAKYIQAAKQSREYKLVSTFELSAVQKAAEGWQKQLGVNLTVRSEIFWPWLMRRGGRFAIGDEIEMRLTREQGRRIGHTYFALERYAKGAHDGRFRVSPSQLSDLAMEFADRVEVIDPANVKMAKFSVAGKSLSEVVMEVCQRGNLDYSFRQDLADAVSLNLEVRNQTPVACLEHAARAAGWEVSYHPQVVYNRMLTYSKRPIQDMLVQTVDKLRSPGVAWGKTLEDVKAEVAAAVKDMLDNRPVVVLEPLADKHKDSK